VVTTRHATNLNRSIPLPRVKKMIELEHTTSVLLQIALRSHPFRHTTLNTLSRMGILQIHAHTSKIHTELPQDLTGMTEDISKIMAEVVRNIWLLASPHRDKEQQLHADIAGDARFAAQALIRIRKDVVLTANDSNKSASSPQFRPKPRHSSQLMLSTLACEIWVLAQMGVLGR
jgi:hypothetical protein